MCFFLSHSFVALAVCFGSLSCWTHPRPIFNALALTVHGTVHHPFGAVQLSCPLSRKTPPNHNVSTSMFDGRDDVLGVIGSIPPPPNTASLSWCQKAGFWSHLETMFGLFHPVLLWIIGKLQTGLYMCFLEQGDLAGAAGFQSFTAWCVTNCFLGDYDPRCLEIIDQILPCRSGLIPHRSHDQWNSTRWDLVWSPSPRETDSYFVFLPFENNHTNCCDLLTKLLGDGLVAHSSLL